MGACDGNRRKSGGKDLSDGEKEDQARRSTDPSTTIATTTSTKRGGNEAEVAKMREMVEAEIEFDPTS